MFYADGRRDGHDEENSRCSRYWVLTAVSLKMRVLGLICSPIPTLTPKTQGNFPKDTNTRILNVTYFLRGRN